MRGVGRGAEERRGEEGGEEDSDRETERINFETGTADIRVREIEAVIIQFQLPLESFQFKK